MMSTEDVTTDPFADVARDASAEAPAEALAKAGMKGRAAAALLTVGLLAGGGVALTQTGSTSTAAVTTTQQGPGPGGPQGQAGFTPPAIGTISAVSAGSVSVRTTAGTVTTYRISSATAIENNGATVTATGLTVGEQVLVFTGTAPGSTTTTDANTANRIMAGSSATQGPQGVPPAQPQST